jgi:hypothetical protein
MSIRFRHRILPSLTDEIGVYALCDLDQVPIYVGQSVQGIRSRVQRHPTSARSDIIANRQVDVWEIAYVWAWPTARGNIPLLEAHLFHEFDAQKTLMNGTIPMRPNLQASVPEKQMVQVMDSAEIEARLDPVLRLPRQIQHYGRLVDHVLVVKDSSQLRRSLRAHFERLQRYHASFLKQSGPEVVGSEN